MLSVTTDFIPGRSIETSLGIARGSVVRARFTSNTIMEGTAEMLAYGTAVTLAPA